MIVQMLRGSDLPQISNGLIGDNVAGVQSRLRFDQDDGEFVVIPRGVDYLPVADDEVHLGWMMTSPSRSFITRRPFVTKKQLVFVLVVVPDKLALHPSELDVRVVELRRDLWVPIIAE